MRSGFTHMRTATPSASIHSNRIWKSHMHEESEEWYSNPHPCKKPHLPPVHNESDEVDEDMFSDDSNDRHKGVLA